MSNVIVETHEKDGRCQILGDEKKTKVTDRREGVREVKKEKDIVSRVFKRGPGGGKSST